MSKKMYKLFIVGFFVRSTRNFLDDIIFKPWDRFALFACFVVSLLYVMFFVCVCILNDVYNTDLIFSFNLLET